MECSSILKNDKESVNYRRNLNTLVVLGTGVIVFGFWGIIKILAQLMLGIRIVEPEDLEDLGPIGIIIVMLIIVSIYAVDVILRLCVGIMARREAEGKKCGKGYLVACGWLIFGSVLSVVLVFLSIAQAEDDFFDNLTAIFMEISSLVITVEVFAASISVRRYRKKRGMEEK